MITQNSIIALLDSINQPIVFLDNEHIIRYLNRKAKDRYYRERGYSDLIGKSLFNCHNRESEKEIIKLYDRLVQGEDEIVWEDPMKLERFTLVAVRDDTDRFVGYYESIERI